MRSLRQDSGMANATVSDEQIKGCREALEAYWRKEDLWFDAKWWTPDEWRALGNEYGNDAVLNLTFEGPLYREFNVPWESHPPFAVQERTYEIQQQFGLYHELGYAWSMHFYPIQNVTLPS
jgi:hypothetical protein